MAKCLRYGIFVLWYTVSGELFSKIFSGAHGGEREEGLVEVDGYRVLKGSHNIYLLTTVAQHYFCTQVFNILHLSGASALTLELSKSTYCIVPYLI